MSRRAVALTILCLSVLGIVALALHAGRVWTPVADGARCVTLEAANIENAEVVVAVHGKIVRVRAVGSALTAAEEPVLHCAYALDAACRGSFCAFLCHDDTGRMRVMVRDAQRSSTFVVRKLTARSHCMLTVDAQKAAVSCSGDEMVLLWANGSQRIVELAKREPLARPLEWVLTSRAEDRLAADDGEWGGSLYRAGATDSAWTVDDEWPSPWPIASIRHDAWVGGSTIVASDVNIGEAAIFTHTEGAGWRVIAANPLFYDARRTFESVAPDSPLPRTCDERVLSLPDDRTIDAVVTADRAILGVTATGLVYRSDTRGWRTLAHLPSGTHPRRLLLPSPRAPVVVLDSGELAAVDVDAKRLSLLAIEAPHMKTN